MRAAVLVELNKPLEMAELRMPDELSFGQVKVKLLYSGICGAQINEIEGAKGPDKFLPHLLGHEASATVLEIAKSVGLDTDALANALEDPTLKERAKREVDAAIAAGVFGSPFFIVDGEPFWGVDRLPMLEQWVAKGGW